MRAEPSTSAQAAEGAVMGYALGFRCEACGAPRSDDSRRLCAQCRYSKAAREISGIEAATSPWWEEPDGVLARVRGDAAVVREIISVKGRVGEGPGTIKKSSRATG
jgi:hypothetical protein